MPAKDLGNKFVCFKCATKFYDMKKPDPICPKCGTDQRESPALRPAPEGGKRSRLASVPKVVEPVDLGDEPEPVADEESEIEEEDGDAEPAASGDDDEA
jgi:uncharacterized protein (TIGR02300 family)